MAEQKEKKAPDKEKEKTPADAAPVEKAAEEAMEKPDEAAPEPTTDTGGKEIQEEPERPEGGEAAELVPQPEELKKPLEKMTAKELREVAVGIPGISGVHAMKKEELLAAVKKAWGVKAEKAAKKEEKGKAAVSVADLKARIHKIKAKRAEAIQRKDKRMARIYRRMINRLKKRTRRAA